MELRIDFMTWSPL